jgi:hypothetical protein
MLSAGEVFIVAKDPARLAARYPGLLVRVFGPYPGNLDNDGESLRIKDTGPGYPATADFLRYGIDGDWPVEANGFGYSLELTQVVPDRDNDLGVYWRASAQLSGSPGFVEGVTPVVTLFRRGDANADGQVDQTDAVYLLSYLFEIGAEPACLQSADTNLSGSLNLTDGVYLLNYLFLESAEPPPPFTACGPAESGEGLTCNAFPACPG